MNNISFNYFPIFLIRVCVHTLILFSLMPCVFADNENGIIVIEATKKTYKVQSINSYIKVNKDVINERVEQNIAEIIGKEEGIQDYSSCSNCGAKRISMNGTKSEAMSITLDELPLYSTLSQFYGLDSLGDSNLESFEVFSGAGEIRDQFESLSGLVNLQTLNPSFKKRDQKFIYETRFNSSGDYLFNVRKNFVSGKNFAHILSVSRKKEDYVDLDKNNVAELPLKNSDNVFFKTKYVGEKINSQWLYNFSKSRTIGGNTVGFELDRSPESQAEETDFENNDVRKKYTGSAFKISDFVKIERQDAYFKNDLKLSENNFLDFDIGVSRQKQNSFFMHGFDYKNTNDVLVLNTIFLHTLNNGNLSVNGLWRQEVLEAKSRELYQKKIPPLKRDDFIYDLKSFSLNYEGGTNIYDLVLKYNLGNKFENKRLEWLGFNKEINKDFILLPYMRVGISSDHYDLSVYVGKRERAPIVNVETQHGNSEYGYSNDIEKFESALNYGAAYSIIGENYQVNFEYQAIELSDVVYGLDRANTSQSTIFKNSTDGYRIQTLSNGYLLNLNEEITLEFLLEKFIHPLDYKKIQKSPLVENRAQLKINYEYNFLKTVLLFQYFSSRDLSQYGYNSNYNYAETDLMNTPPVTMREQKRQKAPDFLTIDWMMDYEVNPFFELSVGVDNILNLTQTKSYNDSPLAWARHGDHFHLDNMHLWGPLKGRVIWSKLKFEF